MSLRQPVYKTVTDEVALSIIGEHLFTQIVYLFWNARSTDLQHFPRLPERRRDRLGPPLCAGLDPSHDRYGPGVKLTIQRRPERAWAPRSIRIRIRRTDNSSPGWDRLRRFKQFGEKLFGMQLLERMDLQFTNSPLFPLEQVARGRTIYRPRLS